MYLSPTAGRGYVVAATLTTNDVHGASEVSPLLGQIDGPVASFPTEAVYDQAKVNGELTRQYPDTAVSSNQVQRCAKRHHLDGSNPARLRRVRA